MCISLFFYCPTIVHCMARPHFVYPSVYGHLSSFCFLATTNKAALNIVYTSLGIYFRFSWCIPGRGFVGLCGNSVVNFLRNSLFASVAVPFHISIGNLLRLLSFSTSQLCQYLLLSVFFIVAILVGVKCYLIVFLICICLMISGVEHHFM